MNLCRIVSRLLLVAICVIPPAFSQLRMHSPYSQDRINPDQTGFILHDNESVEFQWASEWTELTAQSCTNEIALFVWHFKDGSKAYSRQGELVANIGENSAYLLKQKSTSLEDAGGKTIQPLTKNNYPIKVELWIGEVGEAKGYSLKSLVDYLCLSPSTIETNRTHHFSECP